MTLWIRTLPDFDESPALVDNNAKIIKDGGILKLAGEGDEFGSDLDLVHWDVVAGSFTEVDDILRFNKQDPTNNIIDREVLYQDLDLVVDFSKVDGIHGKTYGANLLFWLYKNAANNLRFQYNLRDQFYNGYIFEKKIIGGVNSQIQPGVNIGLTPPVAFRFKRDASTNLFTWYYKTDGSWVQRLSSIIVSAGNFEAGDDLYAKVQIWCGVTGDAFAPELNRYYQETVDIPAQRFWTGLLGYHVINSVVGAVEFVANMGVGQIFEGSGFSATTADPAGSTNKWKLGYGDTADRASATFDVAFRDEAALNVLVAAGAFDNHQYLFLEGQMNSDGRVQPTVTDITISGNAVSAVGAWSPFGNINALGGGIR